MKCLIFGHKFGKVIDGHQYCEKCGLAKIPAIPATPHPCENGHVWKIIAELNYTGDYTKYGQFIKWSDVKVSQQCTKCGEIKNTWKFGHYE
jgi:hypothetical protein